MRAAIKRFYRSYMQPVFAYLLSHANPCNMCLSHGLKQGYGTTPPSVCQWERVRWVGLTLKTWGS